MALALEVDSQSLTKTGEELSGDTMRVLKTLDRAIIVLSDGLGSGVKANILSTLTAEIIMRLMSAELPLHEVLGTVVGTLPACKVRGIAYSTFTVIDLNRNNDTFRTLNFENPPLFWIRQGRILPMETRVEHVVGREIHIGTGTLRSGDMLCAVTDGVLVAGMGSPGNPTWGWGDAARNLEETLLLSAPVARTVTSMFMRLAREMYGGVIGDDATVVCLRARKRKDLMVFTGPPADRKRDQETAARLLNFPGIRAVCGGSTGDVVASYLGTVIDVDLSTHSDDLPPAGTLAGVDILTEGRLTMTRTLALLRESNGVLRSLPQASNPAGQFARALLEADFIHFLVGQAVNESQLNLNFPKDIPSRNRIVGDIADFLKARNREVVVEYV